MKIKFINCKDSANPFNPTTTIKCSVPNITYSFNTNVELKIYDVLGREVKTLVNQKRETTKLILMQVIYQVECIFTDCNTGILFKKNVVAEMI